MSDAISIPAPEATTADRPATPGAAPLRLWPAVVLIVLEWLLIKIPAWVAPVTFVHFMGWFIGPIAATLGLLIWWMFTSRLTWRDRWLGLLVFVTGGAALVLLSHPSVGIFGLILNGLPLATTAWIVWLVLTPGMRWPLRRAGMIAVVLLAWTPFMFVRMDGVNGSLAAAFHFRWSPTTEEQYLADVAAGKIGSAPAPAKAAEAVPLVLQPGDWPGFRGPRRDGKIEGVRIASDWTAQPPRQLWRHRIGPGWSSFAAVGDRVFTQEQRANDEAVVCYDAATGAEVWAHTDAARFDELMAGPGPRATPEFHDGKLYALGAKGKLNCLDAASGKALWTRDIGADAKAKIPQWGFSSSPLFQDGIVTVFAGGPDKKSVLGYRADSGEVAWTAGEGEHTYCSLQSARLCGVDQLLISTERGLTAFAPASGEVLWQYKWLVEGMYRVVLPVIVDDSDVLIGTSFGQGTRRVHVRRDADKWAADEVWKTHAIKPYFSDMVVHRGFLFGFDNNLLACVKLEDGQSQWRAEGYGNGQLLLLADQDLLLVLSETGEVALVDAAPDACKERARFQALHGKTWNHPALAHGRLFVRNGEEAACYELAPAK